jgi:putative FmdB family regulatory protein
MPTYEYACEACKHTWEEFQSMKAEPTKVCPSCKKKKAKRLISAGGGLLFKGSGFYITDYRSDSYKNAAKSDSSNAAPPAASGEKSASGDKASSNSGESKSSGGSESKGSKKE